MFFYIFSNIRNFFLKYIIYSNLFEPLRCKLEANKLCFYGYKLHVLDITTLKIQIDCAYSTQEKDCHDCSINLQEKIYYHTIVYLNTKSRKAIIPNWCYCGPFQSWFHPQTQARIYLDNTQAHSCIPQPHWWDIEAHQNL